MRKSTQISFLRYKVFLLGVTMLSISCFLQPVFGYDALVDKTGAGGAYTTVQAAINAAPINSLTPWSIFIKNGKYREKITVASNKTFIQIIGESVANVVLYYDDPALVLGTQNSASFTINGNDFTAVNITFANTYGDGSQAVAVCINADRAAFNHCRFLGNQDTLYVKGTGTPRHYFRDCYIDGNVDFIFGSSIAVFDSCVVYAKSRSTAGASFITAPSTLLGQSYGFVFRDSRFTNNTGGTSYYLSRPWASPSVAETRQKTVLLSCLLSSHIQAAGWTVWDANTVTANLYYGEYKSRYFNGNTVDISQRVPWSYQLTQSDSSSYSFANMFSSWDPCAAMAGFCNAGVAPEIAVSNFRGTKGSSSATFNWNISWPITGIKYDLYRSNDNLNFAVVNSQLSVNDTSVNFSYAEAIPPPGQTYYYYVNASKAGANSHNTDTVSISSTPTIALTGTLGNFLQGVGIPSASQTYVLSGASLSSDIIITAPAGYEISSNNGTNWYNSGSPILLSPVNGTVANTTVLVRLNAQAAGAYSGNITHTSTGASAVNLAVSGTVQSAPLTVSTLLQQWPLTTNNLDSAAVRASGVLASAPTLNKLFLSNGTTVTSVPAYSPLHGQAIGATSNGDGSWGTAAGGPGGNLNRTFYQQFTVTAAATHSLRIDSLILNSSFHNTSSNTKLAVVYSKSGFTTADSTNVSGAGGLGGFATPILLTNETAGTNANYRIAFNGSAGINLLSGETLTFRVYNSCGSSSVGRYGKIKNVYVLGLSVINPVVGDYRSYETGDWTSLSTWERWSGTAWTNPSPAYPVYNNSGNITIQNGHTVTVSSTLASGSGYTHLTKINQGGQLIVNNGATLNFANDGILSTTDLQVDGTLTALGQIGTNGNVSVLVNGSFVYSGTGINFSNTGDTVRVGDAGIYQHNANSNATPAAMICAANATLLVSGITNNQTGIFKSSSTYGNIVWNCPLQTAYYAFRGTLSNNVLGSFTLANSGSSYLSFANANAKITFPAGFYQTGGIVNFRESGTVADTLSLGGDFSVTGGTFNSNTTGSNTFVVNLTGTNKTLRYSQSGATNSHWNVNGIYTLLSDLVLPTANFNLTVNGTLHTATNVISGVGSFALSPAATLSSGSASGLDGNISVTGAKSFGSSGKLIFNGTVAQTTGVTIPSLLNSLTINNAFDVSLGGNTSLTAALTLSAGKLLLGANSISTPSIVGSSASKYVVTAGAGALRIFNVGSGNTVFPIGPSATSYNPITLNNGGTSDHFAVRVKNAVDNTPADPTRMVNMQWDISEDVAGGSNVAISATWNAASPGTGDEASGFNRNASVVLGNYNGAAWMPVAASVSGTNPYTASAGGFTTFSSFIVANLQALPLTLQSFNASVISGTSTLFWTTSNETNLGYFAVEKSNDGISFRQIGTVSAKNISGKNDYRFADKESAKGLAFYRLIMVDIDGRFSKSNVISLDHKTAKRIFVFPNPASDNLYLSHEKADHSARIILYAADGKRMFTAHVAMGAVQTQINTSSLKAGIYTIQFLNGFDVQRISFERY
jgi:pectin methylesterase-like acyl-CoA thioesterase